MPGFARSPKWGTRHVTPALFLRTETAVQAAGSEALPRMCPPMRRAIEMPSPVVSLGGSGTCSCPRATWG